MKRTGEVALLAAVLSACAGPSAVGQTTPEDPGSLGRLHAYEVPATAATPQEAPQEEAGWIQVSGSGSVTVEPDRARVAFAVETRSGAATTASGTNADLMEAVLSAIRGSGFTGLVLETYGYSLRPEYSTGNNQRAREIVAYTALNNVGATVEDVGSIGRVIDAAISAGANRVAAISFYAANTEPARREALALAVRSARAEAEVIAQSLGHELGAALEVTGGAQRPNMAYETAGLAMASRRADTPIEAGDQTVTASVSIRFSLGRELGG